MASRPFFVVTSGLCFRATMVMALDDGVQSARGREDLKALAGLDHDQLLGLDRPFQGGPPRGSGNARADDPSTTC